MPVPQLADVKAQLKITGGDQDELLNAYLQSALTLVEVRTGPSSVKTFTETVETRGGGFNLSYRPIVSITSIDPLISTWPSYTAADVSFDPRSGAVWTKNLASLVGSWSVTYTAGYTTYPYNYYLAVLLTVQHLYRSTRGGSSRPSQGGSDELNVHIGGTVIRAIQAGTLNLPPAAMELLADAPYFGGIA